MINVHRVSADCVIFMNHVLAKTPPPKCCRIHIALVPETLPVVLRPTCHMEGPEVAEVTGDWSTDYETLVHYCLSIVSCLCVMAPLHAI